LIENRERETETENRIVADEWRRMMEMV